MKDLNELNVRVAGISRDSIESHEKFVLKYDLPFLLLSDAESKACDLYGVIKEKNMYGKKTFGIERSTFIIDPKGYVIKVFRKVKVDGHVQNIIDFLKAKKD